MQTQITPRRVIEEETEEQGEKPLRRSPNGNRSTRQSVGIHKLAKNPPSLIYPIYLSPISLYFNKVSRNHVLSSSPNPATSSMLHLPSLAFFNVSQQHQNLMGHFQKVWQMFGLLTSQWYGNGEVGDEEIPLINV